MVWMISFYYIYSVHYAWSVDITWWISTDAHDEVFYHDIPKYPKVLEGFERSIESICQSGCQ